MLVSDVHTHTIVDGPIQWEISGGKKEGKKTRTFNSNITSSIHIQKYDKFTHEWMGHRCWIVRLFGFWSSVFTESSVRSVWKNINNKFPLEYRCWWSCILSSLFARCWTNDRIHSELLHKWFVRLLFSLYFVWFTINVHDNEWMGYTKRSKWNLKEMKWAQIQFDTIAAYGSIHTIHYKNTQTHFIESVHCIVWKAKKKEVSNNTEQIVIKRMNSYVKRVVKQHRMSWPTCLSCDCRLNVSIRCIWICVQQNIICFFIFRALFSLDCFIAMHFDHGIPTKGFISERRSHFIGWIHFNTFWYDRGLPFVVHTYTKALSINPRTVIYSPLSRHSLIDLSAEWRENFEMPSADGGNGEQRDVLKSWNISVWKMLNPCEN